MSLFGSNTYIGIDIGTTSIKVAEIKQAKNGKGILKNYGILETYNYLEQFNEALQTSSLKLLETETAHYLKQLLAGSNIKTKQAIISLPAFSAFTTIVELPDIPEEEIANVIRFQAKQYIPLSLSAVTVDWEKVGERSVGGDKNIKQVFLIAMLNEQIERYKNILKLADLKLAAFEIEGLSLARALTLGVTPPVLIIDIGARSSSFSIAQDGLLKFVGQSDFAGASLTQVLSTGLGVNVKRAEDLKKHITPELSTLLNPLLDVIINEARRVKNNYENTYKDPINQIVLAGGGSRLSGIANYIQERLGVPVSKGNPFQKVEYDVKLEPALDDLKISLATSIGLGLRQID